MRFAYLSPLDAYMHHFDALERLVVLGDHTNRVCGVATTMYRREQGPWHFGQKLDSEDGGRSGPGEACQKAHQRPTYAWVRPRAIHGVTRPGAWPLQGIPCMGLQWGLGGSLHTFWYLSKNTGVVDESLHIFTLLFGFRIYIDCIAPFTVEIATH